VNQNWGNSVIINHLNGLYTQISHIKKIVFGKYWRLCKKGALIASCGNSGRSPEPHIHFQAQHVPVLGLKQFLCLYPIL